MICTEQAEIFIHRVARFGQKENKYLVALPSPVECFDRNVQTWTQPSELFPHSLARPIGLDLIVMTAIQRFLRNFSPTHVWQQVRFVNVKPRTRPIVSRGNVIPITWSACQARWGGGGLRGVWGQPARGLRLAWPTDHAADGHPFWVSPCPMHLTNTRCGDGKKHRISLQQKNSQTTGSPTGLDFEVS